MNETTIQYSKSKNVTLLVIRIILGALFIFTGGIKAMDMNMTISAFAAMHLSAIVAYLVSYGEIGFGVLLLLGLWSKLTVTILIVIILGALYFTLPLGFAMFVMPLVTLILLVVLLRLGAGKYKIKSSHFN